MESRGKGKRYRFSRTIPSAPLQSSTNPHLGAELGEGAAHKMPHRLKSDGKACSTAFLSQATVPERTAEFAQQTDSSPSRNAQGSRGEALSHPEGAQSQHMPHAHNRRSLNARPHDVPSCGPGPRAGACHAAKPATAPGRNGLRHAQSRSTRKLHIKLQLRAFQRHYGAMNVKTSPCTNVKALLDEGLCHKPSSSGTRSPHRCYKINAPIPLTANPCGSPEGSSPGGPPRGEDLGGDKV
ncbi:hypothetical protein B4V02_21250 [Paenibacillus kribbensis]|uniref:Uncharacterized protein n=1 Tax=Paenibacillus kribbensis TaxID=172713 RepID=A0A222WSW2_9BACL|nr:hypothetical protein [Paenibacillus kribbensis]ASR49042.1 hypothetical protein B4V02_21250 [Paenibacillus kribbensis]